MEKLFSHAWDSKLVIYTVLLLIAIWIGYWYGSSTAEQLKKENEITKLQMNEYIKYKDLFLTDPFNSKLTSISQDIIGTIKGINGNEALININGKDAKVYPMSSMDFFACDEDLVSNCRKATSSPTEVAAWHTGQLRWGGEGVNPFGWVDRIFL